MILRKYQIDAMQELEKKAMVLLAQPESRRKLVFKAPTGAGKTVIMASWLQQLSVSLPLQYQLPVRKLAYLWIAPNQLHEQSLLKLRQYFESSRALRCLQWEDIGELELRANDILFFNWQSIIRDDSLVIRDNESGRTLEALVANTRGKGVELVVILDEAQYFAARGQRCINLLNQLNAKLEVDVSATPWFTDGERVTIFRSYVVNEQMIKEKILLNPDVKDKSDGTALNEYLLAEAYRKLLSLRKQYEAEGSPVRPLLLIQLPSDSQAMSNEDGLIRAMVEQWLEIKGITIGNGKLAVWLSGEKQNLQGIEDFTSPVEVLLFKQAISLGWDCPRSAVLIIYREIHNETFTIQTVGRILRMPEQRHYGNTALNQGYVYTNLSKDMIQVVADDADFIVYEQRAVRARSYEPLGLQSGYLNKRVFRNRLKTAFRSVFVATVRKQGWKCFNDDANYRALNEKLLWDWALDVKSITTQIPKDVLLTGETQIINNNANKTRYARTPRELDTLLHRFCLSAVGSYAKVDSAPVLKMSIILALEEYLDFDEPSTAKVVLKNDLKVQQLVNEALEEYGKLMQQQAKSVTRKPELFGWEVPMVRMYSEAEFLPKPARKHVLQHYFESKSASIPEQRFIAYLESNGKHLRWWYKNGDAGKSHFAVPYMTGQGEWSLFHVDFIIVLSDGTIALFDTKTIGSDPEAARKHNALHELLPELRKLHPERRFIGGILIEAKGLWRYCEHHLENEFRDVEGWSTFDPTNQRDWPDFGADDFEDVELADDADEQGTATAMALEIKRSTYESFGMRLDLLNNFDSTLIQRHTDGSLAMVKFEGGVQQPMQVPTRAQASLVTRLFADVEKDSQRVLRDLGDSARDGHVMSHSHTWIRIFRCNADLSHKQLLVDFETPAAVGRSGLFAKLMELK